MPVWGARVVLDPLFIGQVDALHSTYPEIDTIVDDLSDALRLGYPLVHVSVDVAKYHKTYATKVDYPPHGGDGKGLFLVVYHATEPVTPTMTTPSRVYTLLSITNLVV